MRIHIMGICGTFMAGVAVLARQIGHEVTGSDLNVYPPMSDQLEAQGITLMQGFDPVHLDNTADLVIVGNVVSRGNPMMEHILNNKIPFISGPQWLAENVLRDCWVLAVSGTHGKTTTTSLVSWIMEHGGKNPGFLVGGVPENFGVSARIGTGEFFVIEADEYDSAFFDKRSKFIHYHPKTLILNNLEFDHADIFADLAAIKRQFHYLVRTVPGDGKIIRCLNDANLTEVLAQGCWTPVSTFGSDQADWHAVLRKEDGSQFDVYNKDSHQGTVYWTLIGQHNVNNALAAIAAAHHAGVPASVAIEALKYFKNVKRRMEVKGIGGEITIYDDFAHHPTAVATTLAGLRAKVGKMARIIAILEFGSYTMRTGHHKNHIKDSLVDADIVVCYQRPEESDWGLTEILAQLTQPHAIYDNVDVLVRNISQHWLPGDHVIVMSNSGFGGIHEKLLKAIHVTA